MVVFNPAIRFEEVSMQMVADYLGGGGVPNWLQEFVLPGGSQMTFRNIKFNTDIIVNSKSILKFTEVRFENCHFLLDCQMSIFQQTHFSSCMFDEQHRLVYNIDRANYNFCHFKKAAKLTSNSRIVSLFISDCRFEQKLHIENCKIFECSIQKSSGTAIVFEDVTIQTKFVFHNIFVEKTQFHNLKTNCFVSIAGCEMQQLALMGGHQSSAFGIEKCNVNTLSLFTDAEASIAINYCDFAKTSIGINNIRELNIISSSFGVFLMDGRLGKDCYVSFLDCKVDDLTFRRLKNMGVIEFNHTVFNNNVVFESSDLGRTDFVLCFLSGANCSFTNSKFTDLFLAETEFPEKIFSNGTVDYLQAQLVFGQLRTVYEKMGDTAKSLEYHSRELHAQYMLLKWKSPIFPYVNFTKLNLALNKLSNDFGRNWARAIVVSILIVGIPLFYLLVLSTTKYSFGFPLGWNNGFVGSFLKFMNPIRSTDLEKIFDPVGGAIGITWLTHCIDFISRIFLAYCYYQVIQAFRRYGRK
ncbi:MAG: hypothetical protein V4539_16445 [Bacteroidota bacterium]